MIKRILLTCTLLLFLITGSAFPALTFARAGAFNPPPPWPGEVTHDWIAQHQTATLLVPSEFARQQEARALDAFTSLTMPNPYVSQVLAQVTTAQIYSMTGELSGEWPAMVGGVPYTISSRHTNATASIQKATQYVHEHFTDAGLTATYHSWALSGYSGVNVVGTLPGLERPEEIVIITAHLDSMPSGAISPGADDNASGVVAVLLAAEILSQYQWDCTLRFVAFTGEEQGLLGSKVYAQAAYNNGDNILGVLNLDMIAYDSNSNPEVELHARSTSPAELAIANLFIDVVDVYNLDLNPVIPTNASGASDHASFWTYGYPAILAIEDFQDFTPHYHTVNDRLSTLNMAYYTEFVKAALGTFAHMGCMVGDFGALEGHVTAADTALPLAATVTASGDWPDFTTTTDAAGYYTITLPVGAYTVTVAPHIYGYVAHTAPGVEIITDTVTPLDVALQPYPRYDISGIVTDAQTGVPLTATVFTAQCPGGVCEPHIYAATVSAGETGAYSLSLIAGDYVLEAHAPGYQPTMHAVQVAAPQTQDFALAPRACLLLVDDDQGENAQVTYQADLDALGVEYTTWNVATSGSPTQAQLEAYRHALWLTGSRFNNTLTAADQTALGGYLDGGGNLLLSSWGVGSDLKTAPFLAHYLRASYGGDVASGVLPLAGQDFLVGTTLTVTATAAMQVSKLTPAGGATQLYNLPAPHTTAAALSYAGDYNLAYLGFGLETVADAQARQETLAALLDWLGPCSVESVPVASFVSNAPVLLGDPVQFTNTTHPGVPADTTYLWDFGDGVGVSTAEHPAYLYAAAGPYTVWLTATNTTGSSSVSGTVSVELVGQLPQAQFTSNSPVLLGAPVVFTNTTLTGVPADTTYLWDFGDEITATLEHPSHTYALTGTYTVTLTATNFVGSTVFSATVAVNALEYRVFLPLVVRAEGNVSLAHWWWRAR